MASYLEMRTIELKIKREVERGHRDFIIYPFGDLGRYVKKILNQEYGIKERFIIDNYPDSEGIYPLEYLRTHSLQEEYILVASTNKSIFQQLRDELKKYAAEEKIIDLFEKESFVYQTVEQYDEYAAQKAGFNFADSIYALRNYDVKFYLPFWKTDLIQRQILFGDRYYEDQLLYFVTQKFRGGGNLGQGTVIDIGANIGNHSIYFLKECGAGKVIAFEPVAETFHILKKNIEINGLESRAVLYNCGVGETRSKAAYKEYDLNNIGGTTLYDTMDGSIEICSIDELELEENIVLIKVDVEGYEEKVIKGALKTIRKNKPVIMLEAWDRSDTIENIIMILSDIGYEFQFIEAENYIFYCKE